MKMRIFWITLATIFIVLATICESIVCKTFLSETKKQIEYISEISTSSNFKDENISILINNLDNDWKNRESILCVLVNHKDIEEIGERICELKTSCLNDDFDAFVQSTKLIIFYCDSFQHLFGFTIENIL
ncbi:MAG: DUF4363 family protein [Clostridia bacterium]